LRVSAYWTNVQRVLCISVLIFGLRRFIGHETEVSGFLIGQVDRSIRIQSKALLFTVAPTSGVGAPLSQGCVLTFVENKTGPDAVAV